MTNRKGLQGLSLTEVEALYGSLVATLPAIVYVAEPFPPYATIYTSAGIEALGYTLEEWLARPDSWVRILHPDDREWVLRQTEDALAARRESDFEYRVLAKDGTVHWLHDRGRFVYDKLDGPIRWQGVLLDVTRRKKAEEEREALIEELQKAVKEIKRLGGLLPICSYCKRVRDDQNYWQAVESFVEERSSAHFTHGICPDCFKKHLEPELEKLVGR